MISETSFTTPSFGGKSYLEFSKIHHANRELTVELEFKTLNRDGILLFSSQSNDGNGDFISLGIKNGYVQFRWVYISSPDSKVDGANMGPSGADRTHVCPCWPHELCYLGGYVPWALFTNRTTPEPVFRLLLGVSSGCAWPITGQVTSVTWPVIGWA